MYEELKSVGIEPAIGRAYLRASELHFDSLPAVLSRDRHRRLLTNYNLCIVYHQRPGLQGGARQSSCWRVLR